MCKSVYERGGGNKYQCFPAVGGCEDVQGLAVRGLTSAGLQPGLEVGFGLLGSLGFDVSRPDPPGTAAARYSLCP
jgi:hypothetical protein